MPEPGARTGRAVKALLDLEDAAPDELFEILPGSTVPFWAQVRMRLAWALSEQSTGRSTVASNDWSRWTEATRLAKAFLPSRWDARTHAKRHPVLFYVGGGTLTSDASGARNWLVDDFASATEGAIIVQRTPLPSKLGKPAYRPTLSMEAGIARSRLWARGHESSDGTVRMIDRLLAFYADALGVNPADLARIRTRVMRTEAHQPHELAELRRVAERVQPRIVVMDTASYTYNGESVGVFKDVGAYVAEPQHGWIGPSHAAYNYGHAFRDARLQRALPDELLTFGQYWSESVQFPGKITAIGKPHLEARAAHRTNERGRRILVISSRMEPEATDAFVVELRASVPATWDIEFRPHPAERESVGARYPRLSHLAGITIDDEPDVYDALARARVVVGVASTVLFEAVAFGCEVIARDNAFAEIVIGDAFGERARSAAEVAQRVATLHDDAESDGSPDPRVWSPGSTEAFAAWVSQRGQLHS